MSILRLSVIDLKMVLKHILNGDLTQLNEILTMDHSDLARLAAAVPNLIVYSSALISVLSGLQNGTYVPKDVQAWASFIRRGYVSQRSQNAVRPIPIIYDAGYEDLIAEIVARLDEIGDEIDGDIDETELQEILKALSPQ